MAERRPQARRQHVPARSTLNARACSPRWPPTDDDIKLLPNGVQHVAGAQHRILTDKVRTLYDRLLKRDLVNAARQTRGSLGVNDRAGKVGRLQAVLVISRMKPDRFSPRVSLVARSGSGRGGMRLSNVDRAGGRL
jgi:hypothetical protein